jgi:iron complex outermembrane receptor protein
VRYTEETKRAVVLNRSFSNDTFTTQTAVSADFDKTQTFQNTAPKVSLDYKLSEATKLYGTVSRGFKSGGYNVRANTAAVPDSGKPFADETLDSFEFGSKMLLDGGKLELNAALFHNNYQNVQLSVFTSYTLANGTAGFFGDFTNAGKATVDGGELEFAWRPDPAWTVSGNLASLNARYDEYMDRGVNVADQKSFTNSPKLQASVNLEHLMKTQSMGQVRARLGLAYRSKVYPTTDLSEAIAQDAYTLVSAGVIWEMDKHWTFSLQGSNLTDVAYRTDGYNIPSLDILNGYYGAPRIYNVGLTYKF